MPENTFSLELLSDLGWPVEVFAVVTITLIGRFVASAFSQSNGETFRKDKKTTWDDTVFDAARVPLSWFIFGHGAAVGC